GPKLVARFMDELRAEHLGLKRKARRGPSVREELQAAYEAVVAGKGRRRS
ncbi:MAG: transcriptional regulator, partial [Parvibaculum sp.]